MEAYGNTSIIRSNFSNNFAISYGGAIYLLNFQLNDWFEITDCAFENGSTNFGGAISMDTYGNISLIRSHFSNNFAAYCGGAIYLRNSQLNGWFNITGCVLIGNNSTFYGGAIFMTTYGNTSIIRSDISKNVVSYYGGGAMFLDNSQWNALFEITDCAFENGWTNFGSAIYMNTYGNTSIIRSNFSNNFAASTNGAIYLLGSKPNAFFEIADCAFIEKNSTNNGGAIFMDNYGNTSIMRSNFSIYLASFYSVSIYLVRSQSNSLFEIADCAFNEKNSTNNGGLIYIDTQGNTSIIRCNFSNNFASSYGGAIYLMNSQSNAWFVITDCAFIENNSTYYGGAIYMNTYGNTSIMRSNFSNNFVISNGGGAIYLVNSQSNSLFEITDCAFENGLTNFGGAIYMDTYGNTSIIRSNFSNNFASSYDGGAIYLVTSQANALFVIADCAFIENNSTQSGGALCMNTYGNTSLIRNNFSNNFVSFGGGAINLFISQPNALFEIADCAFIKNNSTFYGGAIYMNKYGNTSIIRSNFSNNFVSTYEGGAFYLFISKLNTLLEIAYCVFIKNNSTHYGGVIYIDTYRNTSIIKSNFSNNFASYGGAIYLSNTCSGAFLQIADCAFIENNSTESGGAIYMEKYGNISIIRSDFSNNFASSYSAALYCLNQSIFFFKFLIRIF